MKHLCFSPELFITLEMSLIFKVLNSQYLSTILEALEIVYYFSLIFLIPHSIFFINSNPYSLNCRLLLVVQFAFFPFFPKLVHVINLCHERKIKKAECIRAWYKDFFTQMTKHWLI